MIVEVENSIQYPGGKNQAGHWQWIISRMPTHAIYAELFAGSAAIFRRKPPALESYLVDTDKRIVEWLRGRKFPSTRVSQVDAIKFLFQVGERMTRDWLVYADPPYFPSTRTQKKVYRHEMTEADHERFLHEALNYDANIMISGYQCPLYNDLLSNWYAESRKVMTRGGLKLETLWTNFNPRRRRSVAIARPGKNWRERQRIARKVERHRRLFNGMPDYEQDAVLNALLEERRQTRQQ